MRRHRSLVAAVALLGLMAVAQTCTTKHHTRDVSVVLCCNTVASARNIQAGV